MDSPAFKGPDAHTILEALTHAGLKRTHPREVIAAYVAQKGEANADFTLEGLWHEVRARDLVTPWFCLRREMSFPQLAV
jgi:hypothetical protein